MQAVHDFAKLENETGNSILFLTQIINGEYYEK
jgi:hypothetical protein